MEMKDQLKTSLKEAMKSQDRLRMDTIRSILADIQYEEMNKSVEQLPATETIALIQRAVKKRQEELQFAEQAGRADLKEKLNKEMQIIEVFLPKQMSSTELETEILKLKEENPAINMGAAMKILKDKFSGQYDGKVASEVAKRVLG